MCLLIYKNADIIIPEEHLEEAFCNNAHGAGFTVRMVNDDGTSYLHRERGFFKYVDFIEAYRPFASHQGIVHFRLATAGKQDEANCHPFEVTPDLHMGHNGIISIAQTVSKDYSDTWHYVELIVKPVHALDPEKFWDCGGLHFLMQQSIGGSKLAFLHADGRYLLINEEAGHWDDEKNPQIWYSNDTYEVPRYRTHKSVGFGGWSDWSYNSTKSTWTKDDDTEAVSHKDVKRLERARKKLEASGNEWLVDDAFDAGMSAAEILAQASEIDGASVLYEFVYGDEARYARSYRTYGDTIAEEDYMPGRLG